MVETQDNAIQLSVCVIGRNEGRHLAACAASLRQLATLDIIYETIFVDSASTDDSVRIAEANFGKVICLAASGFLNAGAARHVGTSHCKGKWILYMDGDMELCADSLVAIRGLLQAGSSNEGLCAFTENVFPDGTRSLIHFKGNVAGQVCRMIGGTSILPRQSVLDAGNWSCELFAYEEAELYSRLLARGTRVIWHACRLVEHKTPAVSLTRKFAGNLIPYRSYLGKKFYGVGQVTQLTIRDGNFHRFARLKPEAYQMSASLLLAALAAPLLGIYAMLLPLFSFLANVFRLGPRGAILCMCWQTQLILGLARLNKNFIPVIQNVLSGKQSSVESAVSLP